MGASLDVNLLCRKWVRASEEDTGAEEVYRPLDPSPQRGRRQNTGMAFEPDGTFVRAGAGATDVSRVTTGTWHARADGNVQVSIGGEEKTLKVMSLAPDRLVVQKR